MIYQISCNLLKYITPLDNFEELSFYHNEKLQLDSRHNEITGKKTSYKWHQQWTINNGEKKTVTKMYPVFSIWRGINTQCIEYDNIVMRIFNKCEEMKN